MMLLMLCAPVCLFADKGMAPYILDGSLLIYFPSLNQASSSFRVLLQKMFGVEYQSSLTKIQLRIKEHLSVNILDPKEASFIGLDPEGPVAYVHLRENVGYSVFRIKNKTLLSQTLNNLSHRVLYKIVEDKYIIFSSSLDVIEYEQFKGIGITKEFQRIAKAVNFNWDQNFISMTSEYFQEKNLFNQGTLFSLQSDIIGGVFKITEKNIVFNLYTIYNNQLINNILKQSIKVSSYDTMSFLDFEFGEPAIVGHLYLNILKFFEGMQQIDLLDELGITKLMNDFKNNGFDLQSKLFPFLTGRISYVVRYFDPLKKQVNLTVAAQIKNKNAVRQFLINLVRSFQSRGITVIEKSLFTQNLFSFSYKTYKLWIGIVEDHFVFSTDEASVTQLIQNIYYAKNGFLRKQPLAFQEFLTKKMVGGQNYMLISPFLNNILLQQKTLPFYFISTLNNIRWHYYFNDEGETIGRRDILILNFI
ncbi:MAG: hypothetical protein ACRCVW_05840 [Brevinema sp.]